MLSGALSGVALAVTWISQFDSWPCAGCSAAFSPPTRRTCWSGLQMCGCRSREGYRRAWSARLAGPSACSPRCRCASDDLVRVRGCTKEQQRGTVQPFIIGMQIVALLLFAIKPGGRAFHVAVPSADLAAGALVGQLARHDRVPSHRWSRRPQGGSDDAGRVRIGNVALRVQARVRRLQRLCCRTRHWLARSL